MAGGCGVSCVCVAIVISCYSGMMTPVAWPAAMECGLCSCGYNVVMTPAAVACFLCLSGYNDVMTCGMACAVACRLTLQSSLSGTFLRFTAHPSAFRHLSISSSTEGALFMSAQLSTSADRPSKGLGANNNKTVKAMGYVNQWRKQHSVEALT